MMQALPRPTPRLWGPLGPRGIIHDRGGDRPDARRQLLHLARLRNGSPLRLDTLPDRSPLRGRQHPRRLVQTVALICRPDAATARAGPGRLHRRLIPISLPGVEETNRPLDRRAREPCLHLRTWLAPQLGAHPPSRHPTRHALGA